VPSAERETLTAIECIQDITEFWAPDIRCKNTLALSALQAKIREASNEFQVKHLTAMLYIPVLSNAEYNEVIH
jgi:hypothetical protein